MAKEFPYFKFFVSEWILGRISDQPDRVQGAFIIAICHYWHKKCDCFVVDFKKKLGRKRFDLLVNLKFIDVENDKVFISFLDEQFSQQHELHPKRVKSGQAGGEASAKSKRETKVKDLEQEEDKEEDKYNIVPRKKKTFVKPTIEEITGYCSKRKNNVSPQKFLNHYDSNGWKVGKNSMKDWEAAIRTWEQNSYDNGTLVDQPKKKFTIRNTPEGPVRVEVNA